MAMMQKEREQPVRANGYVIAKDSKESDNFEVSMDISPDNRMLVFGYGPTVRLVSMNTNVNFWFEDRKVLGKQPMYCKQMDKRIAIPINIRVVRDVKWNLSDPTKIGVAIGESALIYDIKDIESSKTPEGFFKVFETTDVMRQGDTPSKFIWLPSSKDQFLCPSSKSAEIVLRDMRAPNVVLAFNGNINDERNEHKIEDLKFNPLNSHIFATISKHSTIEVFDVRNPAKPLHKKEHAIQNNKTNLLDWEYNGNRLASVYGGSLRIWEFDGPELVEHQSFEHKNAISDLKWLKTKPEYLLVSEMQENIIYGYKVDKQKHDIEILVDPRHSGLKKFMTDRSEQLILGLTNFEDSKKNQHELIGVFIDYKSSQTIWQKTKFTKPNNFGLDNRLLFGASSKDSRGKLAESYALMLSEVESSASKIASYINDVDGEGIVFNRQARMEQKARLKNKHRQTRLQRQRLKKKVKQMSDVESQRNYFRKNDDQDSLSDARTKKMKKAISSEQKGAKPSSKTARSLQKQTKNKNHDKISNGSFSNSSRSGSEASSQTAEWIMTYSEEIQYLDKNYKVEVNEQVADQRVQAICKHNSKVAKSIGKYKCAEFWNYLHSLAFPPADEKYTLPFIYEDKAKIDVHFKENKIIGTCETKAQMLKKNMKYSIEKLIQNLADENELQTAVTACVMLRSRDDSILNLEFIEPFLVSYKQILKAMGLIFISTNISMIAKLNLAIPSPLFNFEMPLGCGQCHKKINSKKCDCLQVCIFCGESLKSRLLIGCKICGHMVHAREYEKWVTQQKCPYRDCQHRCFQV